MKKLLGILVLGLLWCNVGFAKTFLLQCNSSADSELKYPYHLIVDDVKNNVSYAGLVKKTNEIYVYDWIYENVKVNEKKIEYNNTISFFLGYDPLFGRYNKTVIDRYTGEYISYGKDENYFDSLPNFIRKYQFYFAWFFQSWKMDHYGKCAELDKNKFTYKYISKKEWDIKNSQNKKKF